MRLESWKAETQEAFAAAVAEFRLGVPVLVASHNDADGLAAAALFARGLPRAGFAVEVRILGRGENPWSDAFVRELEARSLGGLVVADLGVRAGLLKADTPTIVVDHHVPRGTPPGALVVSGYGQDPQPTSSLLAYWCVQRLAEADDLLWIAALGIIGDMGEKAGLPEMDEARRRYTATALRNATALLNAPRRASGGDASAALALLMKAEGPRDITSGKFPETEVLEAAREEVKRALADAKRVAPKVQGEIALIRLDSPCQIHPLVAQAWRNRLSKNVVVVANTGYRPGWVHFAVRSATGKNLVALLRDLAPEGADENYGGGHEQATGGALPPACWNEFVRNLGFGRDMQVAT